MRFTAETHDGRKQERLPGGGGGYCSAAAVEKGHIVSRGGQHLLPITNLTLEVVADTSPGAGGGHLGAQRLGG